MEGMKMKKEIEKLCDDYCIPKNYQYYGDNPRVENTADLFISLFEKFLDEKKPELIETFVRIDGLLPFSVGGDIEKLADTVLEIIKDKLKANNVQQ